MNENIIGLESIFSPSSSADFNTSDAKFKCSVCFENFQSKDILASHLQDHFKDVGLDSLHSVTSEDVTQNASGLPEDKSQSGVSVSVNIPKVILNINNSTKSDITPHKCPICNQCFVSSEGRDRHMKIHGGVTSFECNVCHLLFFNSSEYRKHVNTHGDNPEAKPFQCSKCDKRFLTHRSMKLHLRTHEDKELQCNVCERNFLSSYHLNIHMMSHEEGAPRKCSVCDKKFCKETDWRKHMKTHSEIDTFACEVCGRSYNSQSALNGHMRTHVPKSPTPPPREEPVNIEKNHCECTICKKSFMKKSDLDSHMEIHESERNFFGSQLKPETESNKKNYACKICNSSFHQSQNLALHMRSHTAEEQYRCFVYEERFRRRQMLIQTRMLLTNRSTKPKPVTATKTSRRKSKRPTRIRGNTSSDGDEKLFRCFVCDKQFSSRDEVIDHVNSEHAHGDDSMKLEKVSKDDEKSEHLIKHEKDMTNQEDDPEALEDVSDDEGDTKEQEENNGKNQENENVDTLKKSDTEEIEDEHEKDEFFGEEELMQQCKKNI